MTRMSALDGPAPTAYGHFTTMRVERRAVRGLGLHLRRLVADCATVFSADLRPAHVRECLRAATAAAEGPLTVRVTVTDPDLALTHLAAPARPRVVVTTRAPTAQPQPPLRVRSTGYARDAPAIKHTGLFGALHERRRAQLAGYDDALFVSAAGLVTEGPTWNIGFIRHDTVVWPAGDALPGITRRLLATGHPGPQRTEPVRLADLPAMTVAFATNAAGGIRPIAAVDGTSFDVDHPVLARLRERYARIVPEPL
ncbi:aminotransferase class IV [Micromonospora sp. DT233]|uniref:aminotransferase class IV n=1 Tax=Micromonospora sp. DT233 TaxID=3393432 RepID=UPI003CF675A9